MTETPSTTMGRCQCADEGCPAKDRHIVAGEGPRAGDFIPCRAHAVRLVTVRVLLGTRPSGRSRRKAKTWEESREVAMCEPCAKHHLQSDTPPARCPQCGAHDPKDDVLDEVDIGVGVQYNRCPDPFHRASHTERTTAKGGRE